MQTLGQAWGPRAHEGSQDSGHRREVQEDSCPNPPPLPGKFSALVRPLNTGNSRYTHD